MAPENIMTGCAQEFARYCYGAAGQCLPGYNQEYFLWRARRWEEYARQVQANENAVVDRPAA
jgi:hypothetical protein